MGEYLKWDEYVLRDFSAPAVSAKYDEGYVFTRIGKGIMDQTRSLRVELSKFELSSENRRILKKTTDLTASPVPLPYTAYDWKIGKLAKDFYEQKFGAGTFSANKIKELLTDPDKSNFNRLFVYTLPAETVGYCIAYENEDLLHYCYPFYNLDAGQPNLGMGMMLRAVLYAQGIGKKYVYLGSAQRAGDTYKLQFAGLEWFDRTAWRTDSQELKKLLT
ncbi:MAG: hypothetical protein UY92_C0014G0022 [Candidatus Magasanikbacteria bacterium GW2011_GWA2_56_11]|uniref:N-end rule aminoacyl transferase C-terminal domain-containing protein n=1 Tax=Candidatus Magasanikbacteria bacterium GW2011_GWA2_56_11 TaxID=1619044 RepID=A0A0G2AKD9_9BACT|nr:MAG: hypothetical protein UY92_C0014G0022 [Candidatus Magasanikbacteria bacterium GW2011_GWA2_56_11]